MSHSTSSQPWLGKSECVHFPARRSRCSCPAGPSLSGENIKQHRQSPCLKLRVDPLPSTCPADFGFRLPKGPADAAMQIAVDIGSMPYAVSDCRGSSAILLDVALCQAEAESCRWKLIRMSWSASFAIDPGVQTGRGQVLVRNDQAIRAPGGGGCARPAPKRGGSGDCLLHFFASTSLTAARIASTHFGSTVVFSQSMIGFWVADLNWASSSAVGV